MMSFKTQVTKDYEKLVPFFIENRLEFSEEEPVPTDIVKCWETVDLDSGELMAGLVLARREGEFIIDGIAVDERYRKLNIGKELLNKAIEETLKLGGNKIFLVARAPGFFKRSGFVEVNKDKAPNFFECLTCPQFGNTCHPEIMVLNM